MDEITRSRILVDKRYVRTHSLTRNALAHVMSDVETSLLSFQGAVATQEAIVNASWLLLDAMGPDWLATHLRPVLALMEAFPAEDDPDYLPKLAAAVEAVEAWKASVRPAPTGERYVRAVVLPIQRDGGDEDPKGARKPKGKGGGGTRNPKGK